MGYHWIFILTLFGTHITIKCYYKIHIIINFDYHIFKLKKEKNNFNVRNLLQHIYNVTIPIVFFSVKTGILIFRYMPGRFLYSVLTWFCLFRRLVGIDLGFQFSVCHTVTRASLKSWVLNWTKPYLFYLSRFIALTFVKTHPSKTVTFTNL